MENQKKRKIANIALAGLTAASLGFGGYQIATIDKEAENAEKKVSTALWSGVVLGYAGTRLLDINRKNDDEAEKTK